MKPRLDPRTHVQRIFQQGESGPPPFRPVAEVWPDLAQQPRLVLGIRATVVEVHTLRRSFGQPKPSREWLRLIHQAGGSQRQPHLFWVTQLRPRAQTQTGLKKLAQYYAAHPLGGGPMRLEQLLHYQTQLQEYLGVECNRSYADLVEGIYPIDLTPEHLLHLAEDELPTNLDELLERGETYRSANLERWGLWGLTSSSE